MTESELAEGERLLDRYVIIDQVGSGGMATIYRAHDERLDRVVCIKLLKEDLAPGGSTAGRQEYRATYDHFLKEALALSRLQHPNTLRIYDFGYLEGKARPFQVSEFLDGGNLEQHVRKHGALDFAEVLAILEGVTGALAEAHEKGIVHRDVKPSNILFGRIAGQLIPKLADFGIARSDVKPKNAEDSGEHVSTVTLFSPRWAAPEQIAGSSVDPATDVYSLGLVTAFMLTGVPLFEGKNVRATFAERVVGDNLVAMRLKQTGTPPEAMPPLLRALAANPKNRTRVARQFFEQLRLALSASGPESNSRPRDASRDSMMSISVEQELSTGPQRENAVHVPPHEDVALGSRQVQIVDVDPIDLAIPTGRGFDVRFRATLLFDRDGVRLNVKGLNCFVSRLMPTGAVGAPTPAIVSKEGGAAHLISSGREQLATVRWAFGDRTPQGLAFRLDGGQMVVPYTRAGYAVAFDVGPPHPIVVVCKR